jgi:hypothetical protein
MRKLLAAVAVFAALAAVAAEAGFEFWPGTRYDPRIPTFRKVLGYDAGERISSPEQLLAYLDALTAASPRIKTFDYGRSWEGRKLVYAAVGSEANLARLEEVRQGMLRLADPRRTPEAEAKKLTASLPAVIWLACGVHGNEISSPEAALLAAYHLAAARGDDVVDGILNNAVVLLAPLQNPDGRARFVAHFEQSAGLEPNASPAAAEHMEPWPGGRGNHYLFDLNRDWFALTQPEIRAEVKALRQWYPLVFADLHEMGSEATYYFAPGADPYNPHVTATQRKMLDVFGRHNAGWFDRFGFDYFTRDVFDAFYPGYGDSWPAFYGAIGMTYEQATSSGLVVRRRNETVLRYREAIRHHFTASISTAEAAAKNRQALLEAFYQYRKTAIEEGSREAIREYVLPRTGDVSAVDKLAAVLVEQGVEVKRAAAAFKAGGREFPAGSYAIPLAQPSKRLIRTLLDRNVPMDPAFVKEQERRRRKKLPEEIYDVTAWSLPLAYNVEAVAVGEPVEGSFEALTPERLPAGRVAESRAPIAWLVPWGTQAAGRFLAAALRQSLQVFSSDKAFRQNGRTYPAGTLVVKAAGNPAGLAPIVERLAKTSAAEVVATDLGWVEEGPNFGSRRMVELKRPEIALAWDRPASATSAGWARFVLERQYGYPVTAVRTHALGMADLARFQAIVLPDASGDYAQTLGPAGVKRLKEWVADGGTLVAIGGAVSFAADPKVGLLAVAQENAARPVEKDKKTEPPAKPEGAEPRVPGKLLATEEEYQKAIQPETELPDRAPGAMVRARLDPDHWLTAGLAETVNALLSSDAVFTPIKLDKGVNAAVFAGPDQLVSGGHLWEETRKQLAYKPLVIVQPQGRGQVIAFTADPNFRAYLDGMNLLFVGAVLRGPGHAHGGGEE